MPRGEISLSHRPKSFPPLYACVARPVNKKEHGNAKAKAALQKEWDKLTSQGCWDLSTVQEWHDVAARARKEGEKIHVGRIFDICVEKNHELPEDDPNRKYIRGESCSRDVSSVMRSGIGPCSPKTPPAPPLWRREKWVMLTGYFPRIF